MEIKANTLKSEEDMAATAKHRMHGRSYESARTTSKETAMFRTLLQTAIKHIVTNISKKV